MEQKKWTAVLLALVLLLCACSAQTQLPPGNSSASGFSFASGSSLPAPSSVPGSSSEDGSALQPSSAASSAVSPALSSASSSFASSAASSAAPSSAASKVPEKPSSKTASKAPAKPPSQAPEKSAPPSKAAQNPSSPANPPMAPVTARMPSAPGRAVFAEEGAVLDYSNAAEGYVMVKYSGGSKIKLLVYYNGGSAYYQYNLSSGDAYTTIPLQSGSGSYRIRFMENVEGSSYAELCSTEISASCGTNYALYPSQYVHYTRSSAAVAKAQSLCAAASSDAEKVQLIYRYLCDNIKYDYSKAVSTSPGYLPSPDGTLASKKGICFDYSALMAAMLRSQNIPTKLVIGNTSEGYHAWNMVYVGGWKRYDSTFGAMNQTAGTYTPQRYY